MNENFNVQDVVDVASALIHSSRDYDNGDYSPVGHFCKYCDKSSWTSFEIIKHQDDCPYLKAVDLLTGYKLTKEY